MNGRLRDGADSHLRRSLSTRTNPVQVLVLSGIPLNELIQNRDAQSSTAPGVRWWWWLLLGSELRDCVDVFLLLIN